MQSPKNIDYIIEPLSSYHNKEDFFSGIEELDLYLKRQASQDQRRYIATPFIAFDRLSQKIIGYYTLSSTSINLEKIPSQLSKKLPKYPLVPATLLGRLAIDKNYQKKGWGKLLLIDAISRSLKSEIASYAVVVEAISEEAAAFYRHYNFINFLDSQERFFLPMTVIKTILS